MLKAMKTVVATGLSAAMLIGSALAGASTASAQSSTRSAGSYDVAQNWDRNWNGRHHRGPGWQGGPPRGPGWNRPPPPRYGYRHPGWRGPGYYYRPGYQGRYYYNNYNAALAAGVFGLAAGAIIGGAAANAQNNNTSSYIAYCSQRYRSFNPATGTYTGYDGLQHRCIMQ